MAKKETEITLSINNTNIERVNEIKFLGIMLDENLTWKSHINYVKNKVSKSLFILNKSKYILPRAANVILLNDTALFQLLYRSVG